MKNFLSRKNNLLIIKSIFYKQNLKFWLTGWTLLYAFKAKIFSKLPFDEIGVWYEDFIPIKNKILNQLKSKGFNKYKENNYIIVIGKDGLLININFFHKNKNYCLTNEIKIPIHHFTVFENLNWMDEIFSIPSKTNKLIELIFSPSK